MLYHYLLKFYASLSFTPSSPSLSVIHDFRVPILKPVNRRIAVALKQFYNFEFSVLENECSVSPIRVMLLAFGS
jgi:hypothetical protein